MLRPGAGVARADVVAARCSSSAYLGLQLPSTHRACRLNSHGGTERPPAEERSVNLPVEVGPSTRALRRDGALHSCKSVDPLRSSSRPLDPRGPTAGRAPPVRGSQGPDRPTPIGYIQHMKIVVFTGAGVSRESGLLTFRDSEDGLWEGHDVMAVASIQGWWNDPQRVLDFYNSRRRDVRNAEPNAAHKSRSPSSIEHHDVTIITQNVDNLHERSRFQQKRNPPPWGSAQSASSRRQ